MRTEVERSILAHVKMFDDLRPADLEAVEMAARRCTDALRRGHKLLVFGNGGSAADAQHIAAELVGKFRRERKGLPAIALTVNTSVLTALANDFSYDEVFARQIEALGHPGDVALGLSASGNSPNVVRGIESSRDSGLRTIAFTGRRGGRCAERAELCFRAPTEDTPRIEEMHITMGHILSEVVEAHLHEPSPPVPE